MSDQTPTNKAPGAVAQERLVRRFAYRRHPDERIRKFLPDEIQVGWEFEDHTGKCFIKFGSTRNRDTLKGVIADAQAKFGPLEVVDLDAANH